ncbi:MucR family transcriptional regulator [Ancylobacter aquaticus]|uniref:MucR family transcriptional regulator n=1 Tax=Ancylobacter aquaticus TaxID=100 RepID=A0A4R1HCH2_ANCAQ|nr:MucR family transcriptional regulator [Ancylobacter aquaticus]TCK19717.1 MucR family transcriptional regulator [Ancylobacter aquaticus]
MSEDIDTNAALMELTAGVVSAFVGNNSVPANELPALIASVHSALLSVGQLSVAPPVEIEQKPAVPIKKSVTPDFIICLEDGLKFKSLKRHLRTKYALTPEDYRAKWGLPNDYPMVAPSYAEARSNLAKKMGLGQQRKKPVVPAPKPRGRAPKAAAA